MIYIKALVCIKYTLKKFVKIILSIYTAYASFPAKKVKQFLSAMPNVGRSIGGMAFSAVIFFILKKSDDKLLLFNYSWLLIIANLCLSITGWGLRDYSIKEYVQNAREVKGRFSEIASSKIPLLLLSCIIISVLNFSLSFKLYVISLVFLRTIILLFDPLILIFEKTLKLFIAEALIYSLAIGSLLFLPDFQKYIFSLLIFIEVCKIGLGLWVLIPFKAINFKLSWSFRFLYETRFYFGIAIFSFCMSRVDVYILGADKKDISFTYYNILLNLVSVSQIFIAAVYNKNVKSIFRMKVEKANEVLKKLIFQFVGLSVSSVLTIYVIASVFYQIELSPYFYVLLLINMFCYCLTLNHLLILNHLNKLNYFLIAAVTASFANFICALLLIPPHGMFGALLSNTVGTIVLVIILKGLMTYKKTLSNSD